MNKESYRKYKETNIRASAAYNKRNPDKVKAWNHTSYLRHKEKILKQTKKYQQNNTSYSYRFSRGRSSAKERGLSWEINLNQYMYLIKQGCDYCHNSLEHVTGYSLDRLNNSLGYSLDNLVACCGDCNAIRGNKLTPEELKVAISAVLQYRNLNRNR